MRETFPDRNLRGKSDRTVSRFDDRENLMITDGKNYLSLAINIQPLVKAEAKVKNELTYQTAKPLSSYLPKELPVFSINSEGRQMIYREVKIYE